MTTAQEKLVVRVSLSATAVAPGELPEPTVQQQWHWRRIVSAVLVFCAAVVLLYGWLHVELPPEELPLVAATTPVVITTTEIFDAETAELVLEAVPQNPEPEPVAVQAGPAIEAGSAGATAVQLMATSAEAELTAVAVEVATQPSETGGPLFKADSGELRLVLLTDQVPTANARSVGDHVDAASIARLALYSEVQGLNGHSIEHLWYYEGKLMTRIKLPVKLDYWRTYSRKEFDARQKGEWRVEILDPQQNLLFSHHFHYQ